MRITAVIMMVLALLGLLIIASSFGASYPNIMIVDNERHLLKINTNGSLTVKDNGASSAVVPIQVYPCVSIGDTDGHLLKINTNGSLTIKGGF